MPETHDAIVVGAGHNGLVAAAYLARAGLRTLVLERREVVGGAAVSEEVWPGWRVSTAAYVCSLLHPRIVADLELTRHGYAAYRKEPASFTPLRDGRSLLLGSDAAANAREIAAFRADDVAGFAAFETEAARLGSLLFDAFERPAPPRFDGLGDAATQATLAGSVAALVERYVATPVLAATLATDGLIGTYAGPHSPGTAYVLAHHHAGRALGVQGAWGYVRGGMGAISSAIAAAARVAGAEIRTNAEVARIATDPDGTVRGVVLATTGEELRAPRVFSNADPRTTYLRLLADAPAGVVDRERARARDAWRSVGSSLKLNLALAELPEFTARPGRGVPQPHHRATIHVAPSIEHLQRAHDDARRNGVSSAPMLECFLQTPTDPTLAPPGKHLLSIFAQHFPYDRRDGEWNAQRRAEAAASIVATLAAHAPNLPAAIEAQQILAPPDLERRFGLAGGHIFHGELLPGQIFEDRFAARTPAAGLFLCGSGAHPGGCVSGIPGWRAVRLALADLGART